MKSVSVIGGGLAGCEAAYVIAESGIHVNLFEMKPGKHSPAHKTDDLCELVCSNSLRSDNRPFLRFLPTFRLTRRNITARIN